MEINIKNAFREAVKFSCGPCVEKYHVITEMNQKLCLQMISFFLKRPFLTTALFSVFIILFIIILSAAFITLVGVLIIAIVILLFEGFIFIVLVIVISMIIATVTLTVMILVGLQDELRKREESTNGKKAALVERLEVYDRNNLIGVENQLKDDIPD